MADGNCYYRCIALELFNSQDKHGRVRKQIVDHMKNNRVLYMSLVDGDYDSHVNGHRFTDGNVTSWATEAEIYAAATVYGSNIQVYKVAGNTTEKLTFRPMQKTKVKKKIFLKHSHDHFEVLRVREHLSKAEGDEDMGCGQEFDGFEMKQVPKVIVQENEHNRGHQSKSNRKAFKVDCLKPVQRR